MSSDSTMTWPLTRFSFRVFIGPIEMSFQTVEGLEAEIGVIEYRDGNSPFFGKERMPGMLQYSRVTLKKGSFSQDDQISRLFDQVAVSREYTSRRTLEIHLLDHNMETQFIWRLEKAFITKYIPSNFDAESENEVAVEEMEFAFRHFETEVGG